MAHLNVFLILSSSNVPTFIFLCNSQKNHSEFIFSFIGKKNCTIKNNRNREKYVKKCFFFKTRKKGAKVSFLMDHHRFWFIGRKSHRKKYCCKSLFDLVKNVCRQNLFYSILIVDNTGFSWFLFVKCGLGMQMFADLYENFV